MRVFGRRDRRRQLNAPDEDALPARDYGAEHGPWGELWLGDEAARMQSVDRIGVDPGDVVCYQQQRSSRGGRRAVRDHLNIEGAQRTAAQSAHRTVPGGTLQAYTFEQMYSQKTPGSGGQVLEPGIRLWLCSH